MKAAGRGWLGRRGAGAWLDRRLQDRLEERRRRARQERATTLREVRAEVTRGEQDWRRSALTGLGDDAGSHRTEPWEDGRWKDGRWDYVSQHQLHQHYGWYDEDRELREIMGVLEGRYDHRVEEVLERHQGRAGILAAFLERPQTRRRAQLVAAVQMSAEGVVHHSLLDADVLERARRYRDALAHWKSEAARYGRSVGTLRRAAGHLEVLEDPVALECFQALAPEWAGTLDELVEASRAL